MNKEMTKQQRDYAIGRVKGLRNDAIRHIEEKHPEVPKVESMSNDEQVRLIRAGKVKIFPPAKSQRHYGELNLKEVFDFGLAKDAAKKRQEVARSKAQKIINKETGPIYVEAVNIIDKIMLGDAAEALKLIEGFAKMCK